MAEKVKKAEKHDHKNNDNVEMTRSGKTYQPDVDIYEQGEDIYILAEMAGITEKSVDISLERNVLTINGTLKDKAPEGYDLVYSNYEPGNYYRTFRIPDEINRDKIEATVNNGVLKLKLPKAEPDLRKITVKAS
ncbi:MAG: Hsp20/alpha crystallin family protein [Nitrospinae bacterium]|nr:Hsp20/alpha crystallin family protein [Nitrospinota bacterium]